MLKQLIILAALFLIGCAPEDGNIPMIQPADQKVPAQEVISESRELTNGIHFPVGTIVQTTASGIRYELPAGYRTLFTDVAHEDKLPIVWIGSAIGGYSCVCSGGGACTVIYTQQGGYGCLQSDCTGSCTGSHSEDPDTRTNGAEVSEHQLVGIISLETEELAIGEPRHPGHVLPEYQAAFFALPEVRAEIKKNYDFAYANYELPTLVTQTEGEPAPDANYVMLQAHIYGVSFGMLVPGNTQELADVFPEEFMADFDPLTKNGFSCDGSNGCTCVGEKQCAFGYCVWTCSGCSKCTLTVE